MVYLSSRLWTYFRSNQSILSPRIQNKYQWSIFSQIFKWLNKTVNNEDARSLYLNEKYLRVVKLANRSVDSKSVVDRATKKPLSDVLSALKSLNEASVVEIKSFVDTCLHEPGFEIERAEFCDWNPQPKFIKRLKNHDLIEFSLAINKIWLDLYKKFDSSKLGKDCVSSHLAMKYPFVVPGGRFIEIYYWDTYWTLEGLLVCGMFDTARKMLENFLHFIEQYGFIPNGSRIYYLNRSQPPYFSQMVMKYLDWSIRSKDLDEVAKADCERFVLNEALPSMIKEHSFWMSQKSVIVKIDGIDVKLNIYKADTTRPRPESYFEDLVIRRKSIFLIAYGIPTNRKKAYDS